MDSFCGSAFWDPQLAWEVGSSPDFTTCFQETVLLWIPCGFLWLLLPFEIHYYNSRKDRFVPWTFLNVLKVVLLCLLCILSLLEIVHAMLLYGDGLDVFPVTYYAPFIRLATFLAALALVVAGRRCGVHTSGVMFIFWLLMTLSSGVHYRSMLIKVFGEGETISEDHFAFYFTLAMVYFPLIVGEFLLSCFADTSYLIAGAPKNPRLVCPEATASFLSQLLFWWFNGMAILGFLRPLRMEFMWKLQKHNQTEDIVDKFSTEFEKEKQKRGAVRSKKPDAKGQFPVVSQVGIMRPLLRTFSLELVVIALLKFTASVLTFVNPLVLDMLIGYVNSDDPIWKGLLFAFTMFFASMVESLLNGQYDYRIFCVAMRMRSAIINAVYQKTLKLSSTARSKFTTGEIVTLMSVDTQRVMDYMQVFNLLWVTPLQIGIAIYLLWGQLGVATMGGVGIMLLLLPINGVITAYIRKYQVVLMKQKDKRIKIMNEILGGIKVLKLYAWEKSFRGRVEDIREKEVSSLKVQAYLSAAIIFAFTAAPFLVAIASFAVFVMLDPLNVLDANKAFVSLSLFNILRVPMAFLPMLITFTAMFFVSLARINKYLRCDELDPDAVHHSAQEEEPVVMSEGTFAWSKDASPTLHDVGLRVPKGSLLAIVGSVGSGKSSILSALLGDMVRLKGRVNINGSVAYCPQQAWIQNASVKSNILFGQRCEQGRYEQVIDACALRPDLAILPGGDETEVGEKGINLSGGQKQRISLARAVYSGSDIYFLDDSLSAVDSHVGKHIFDKVIGPKGLLKDKTRILVTHRLSVLPEVGTIVVLKDGRVSDAGTYNELVSRGGAFSEFLVQFLKHVEETQEGASDEDLQLVSEIVAKAGAPPELVKQYSRLSANESDSGSDVERRSKPRTTSGSAEPSLPPIKEKAALATGSKLTEDEVAEVGSVKWWVYLAYVKAMGTWCTVLTLFAYVLSHAFNIMGSLWLSAWSNDALDPSLLGDAQQRDWRLGMYGMFGAVETVFVLVASVSLNLAALRGSKILHNNMLQRVLKAPMSFFDTTPMGRILNRFSKDVDTADVTLRFNLRMLLMQFFRTIASFIVISMQNALFLAFAIPLLVLYYFMQKFYIATSRQLKRLESISRSPIYVHFSETVTGSSSIRAYGAGDRFVARSNELTDINHASYFPSLAASRWLGIRLEFLGYTIVFVAALLAVLTRETLSPGLAGLSVSYALTVTATLNMLVRATSDMETNLVSVERCLEYSRTPQEAAWEKPERKPPTQWPAAGRVQFDNYSTRYRNDLDLVLKGVTCDLQPGEMVGVVGRTGAGKSSLTLSLFRLIEAAGGSITIDGVDIATLGLHDLRSKLTIIPQDPVLFSGNIRNNLDPFEEFSDDEVWLALEHAHLKDFVAGLEKGLLHDVTEGGDNISVGQRQLVCLARALLRKSRILILDEATAAVDMETDELIQQTIRREFSSCTIITIAHRLNTIMDYDRVMVLDSGSIVECAPVEQLLKDEKSVFYSLAKDANLV
ncbi:multidrug resistance-associated protein 1-like [Ornithodoros turicata]|uniref:multidrug resistance-associated protein 1-like n=1 Tax=Ornithodoros turicata TaxID=34597 RepID=UPI0031397DB7